jgi:Tol biopolymer transport system component
MKVVVPADRSIRTRAVLTVLALAGAVAAIAGGSADAGSQAANGRIAYVSDAACRFGPTLKNDDIFSMAPDGSGKADLTMSANPDGAPAWSADGTKLAFTRPGKANNDDIFVMSSNGKAQKNVTKTSPDDANPDWTPDGSKITYDVGGAQVFEANQDGTGKTALVPGGYEAAWSSTGKIAYSASVEPSNSEIFVANADGGGAHNVTNAPGYDDDSAVWSPDGTKIAFVRFYGSAGEIFVMNADGSGQADLTNNPANDGDPTWSPDGSKIAFTTDRGPTGDNDVFVMNADGRGQADLTNNPANDGDPTWSPDGSKIAFTTDRGPTGDNDVFVMNADGSGQTDLTNSPANESDPDWQPLPGATPAAPGPTRLCKVPNLVGQKLATARAKARKAGCVSGTVRYVRSKRPRGRVFRQSPRKGLRLCFGVRVKVVVSRGLR